MTTVSDESFRFFDNREKYLLFATTCSEKRETAKRVGRELDLLSPRPPAFRVFQTGSGEGTILNLLLRQLHFRWADVPFLVVVREKNPEFIRMALDSLADRFREHPALVVVVTNLGYRDLARDGFAGPGIAERLMWRELALTGTTAQAFDAQINGELRFINEAWERRNSAETGMAVSAHPAAFVLYRADRRFALDRVVPARDEGCPAFDLIVASHPYRARLPAPAKAGMVLAPLAARLARGGRLIAIQARGDDPGMEIIREVWPEEAPFTSPRGDLLAAIESELGDARPDLAAFEPPEPEFRYHLQLNPNDVDSSIGTSTLLAAWNAATYVAQIDDARLTKAMSEGAYLDGTRKVLAAHQGLWFNNECLIVARAADGETPR